MKDRSNDPSLLPRIYISFLSAVEVACHTYVGKIASKCYNFWNKFIIQIYIKNRRYVYNTEQHMTISI